MFMSNSSTLSSIWGVVWRIPYEPGVPTETWKTPSRKTWVGDIMVPAFRPGRTTFGDGGLRSILLRLLLGSIPAPGTGKPEPNGIPRPWVTETTVPEPTA